MASDDVLALLAQQIKALANELKLMREELLEKEGSDDRGSEALPAPRVRSRTRRTQR